MIVLGLLGVLGVSLIGCWGPRQQPVEGMGDERDPGLTAGGDQGQLAYLGNDGNVYVTSANLAQTIQLTDDATTGPEGMGRSYHRIAWSPNGRYVAYATRTQYEAPYFGPIHVLDLGSGRSQQVTAGSFQIQAFFWSPSGDRLAYLTRLDLPDSIQLQWRVYDLRDQQDRGYVAFAPSYRMKFLVGSFDQYGQSHRLWSPDGRYLAYADSDEELVERVWLLDTQADRFADPLFVGEGGLAVWSWH